MRKLLVWPICLLSLPALLSAAETSQPAKPVNPVGVDELASVTLGLLVVLGLIFALAWLYRRYGNIATLNRSDIRIVGGVSLGSREKAVLLEVDGKRLLVGVAAGQVNTLHVFDEADSRDTNFAQTLQQQQSATQDASAGEQAL